MRRNAKCSGCSLNNLLSSGGSCAYRYLSGLECLKFMARFHISDKAEARKMVMELPKYLVWERD